MSVPRLAPTTPETATTSTMYGMPSSASAIRIKTASTQQAGEARHQAVEHADGAGHQRRHQPHGDRDPTPGDQRLSMSRPS